MTISNQEYFTEVKDTAAILASEAMQQCDNDRSEAEDLINDTLLHETIDGHQWIIYYSYNLPILQHSNNDPYMIDCLGEEEAGHALKVGGLRGLHQALAFWAFYADVQEYILELLDELENELEECEE